MWQITDFDDVEHRIVYVKKRGEGDSLSVEIKAVPTFFDDFDTDRIYEEYNEHMTAQRCFSIIFEDTDYNVVLNGSFNAVEWQGLGGGETRLEMFKRALERYQSEFRIVGNTVYIENLIGRDTQFQYRYRLNASNITKEHDAKEMWTYAKGYADYEDDEEGGWENAKLIREYTSPLANLIGIRHAPPIKDGRIKHADVLDGQLKTLVDDSVKISIEADIHDLRRQGSLAQPEMGDRVFVIDERIGLDEEVRVVAMSVTRNWRGEVTECTLTYGSEGVTKRYQSNLSTAVKDITEVMAGRKKLPYSVLDNAVLEATQALQNAQTELKFTNNGILAIDKNDPNLVTLFNSAGLGVSRDGGATFENAITGYGVNASVITTGSMLADRIAGGVLTSLNGNTEFNLNDGHLRMDNTEFQLGGGASIEFLDAGNTLIYRRHDSTSGYSRSAGIGVGNAIGRRYPFTYLGTTGSSNLDTLSASFTGFVANTNARILNEGSANAVYGQRFRFLSNTNYDKQIEIDFITNTISWFGNDLKLGKDISRLHSLYSDRFFGDNITFNYPFSGSRLGYVMENTVKEGRNPAFRPQYGGELSYDFGTSTHVWRRGYINTVVDLSTKDEKLIIGEADVANAVNFVDSSSVKEFVYKNDDITIRSNKRLGLIYEEVEESFDVIKGDADNINLTNVVYSLLLALQRTRQEVTELQEIVYGGY